MDRLLNKGSETTEETSMKDQSEEEPFPPKVMKTTVASVVNNQTGSS